MPPRLARRLLPALGLLVLAPVGALSAQVSAVADPVRERALRRFRDLADEDRQRLLDRAYELALSVPHPLARAAAGLEAAAGRLSVADPDPARAFAPERYAPALHLRTRVQEPGDPVWEQTARALFAGRRPPDRDRIWEWDPGRRLLLRPRRPAQPEQRLARMFAGDWPDPSRLTALAEAALQGDSPADPVADYFRHHYRDREGRVFAGIRLVDAWNSGRKIEVSDVEAVAFLRLIQDRGDVRSPIPARLHDPIYRRIAAAYAAWREAAELRRALAVRLCSDREPPRPVYSALSEAIDSAWVRLGHDPARASALLARHPDRRSFFAAIQDLPEEEIAPPEDRAGLAGFLRWAVEEACREEGLLRLGRR
ncbi:MAG: hypothetical protein D6702_12185 [Planctomycetota bacterium]|nr:MAG: hypothetical protein D6702_12185 [Planctomycetota bacterium]